MTPVKAIAVIAVVDGRVTRLDVIRRGTQKNTWAAAEFRFEMFSELEGCPLGAESNKVRKQALLEGSWSHGSVLICMRYVDELDLR